MAAPATNSEFLDLVNKSGVADNERLEAHVVYLRKSGTLPTEPKKLAGVLVRDGLLTRFQAEQIMLGKWRRFTIGKYKVLERLGSGGMGSVYLCEHKLMRRRVAVKVLPTAKAADPSSLERFYREARAVAALDHPNIVHAYDIDQDSSLHFLVMEYVDGASLQEIVKKAGPLDPVRAAHYIHDAALGLEHAHQAGLVHRDVKPGNVLVDRIGVVKLLDMGLARFFNDEDDVLTKKYDENVLGTADYLAPEQALDSHTVDIRADIYGLGATFYFLLSGQTPFGEGTVAQKLIWHQTRQPKSLKEIRQDIPNGILAVLEKMMAKEPGDRYSIPIEVATALAPWTESEIAPPSDSEMPRLSLAATGGVTQESTMISSKPRSGGSSLKNWQVSAPARSPVPAPVSPPPTSPTMPIADTPSPNPSILAPEKPEPSPPDSFWGGMTSDTHDPTAQDDTAPKSDSVRVRQTAVEEKAKKSDRRQMWMILAMGGLLFVSGLGAAAYIYFFQKSNEIPSTRPPLIVSRDHRGPYTYTTLRGAVANAKNGDVIEIHSGEIRENLIFDKTSGGATALTIRAGDGKTVVWRTGSSDGFQPLLRVANAPGFKLLGNGITFDGVLPKQKPNTPRSAASTVGLLGSSISPGPLLAATVNPAPEFGKVQDLVQLYFRSPGLRMEGAAFQNYQRSGIYISNFAGDEKEPAVLEKLRFESIPDIAMEWVKQKRKVGKKWTVALVKKATGRGGAILFDANKKINPPVNDYMRISDSCQFLGIIDTIAIRFERPDVIGSYLRDHLPSFVSFKDKK